jgi:hypothetical protein
MSKHRTRGLTFGCQLVCGRWCFISGRRAQKHKWKKVKPSGRKREPWSDRSRNRENRRTAVTRSFQKKSIRRKNHPSYLTCDAEDRRWTFFTIQTFFYISVVGNTHTQCDQIWRIFAYWRLFALGSYFNITEVAQLFVLLFLKGTRCELIFTKSGSTTFRAFFHRLIWSPCLTAFCVFLTSHSRFRMIFELSLFEMSDNLLTPPRGATVAIR